MLSEDMIRLLTDSGIDYRDGVEKFMEDADIYETLLGNFLRENTFEEARDCASRGDLRGFEKAVHAMKSVTGTLSMNGLYRLCAETVSALRSGETGLALDTFDRALEAFGRITDSIRKAGLEK